MPLPNMTKDEIPNDQNFIVFGVVNEYGYTNHRGETEHRRFIPLCIRFGISPHHSEEQWLLETFDADKCSYRTYALAGIQPR